METYEQFIVFCFVKDFCLRFIVRGSNFKEIIMTQQFETLPTSLMVEIVRRRHFPVVSFDNKPLHSFDSFDVLIQFMSFL